MKSGGRLVTPTTSPDETVAKARGVWKTPLGPRRTPIACVKAIAGFTSVRPDVRGAQCEPANKFDLDAVYELDAAGYPAIAPLLDDLIAWTADGNWPVARPIADLLVSTGAATIPVVRGVLRGTDPIHQYFISSVLPIDSLRM
jgi:hypothetical protein